MADPKVKEAVEIVARHALTRAVHDWLDGDAWGDYPELMGEDWEAVADRVREITHKYAPAKEEYEGAYDLLMKRAEEEESSQCEGSDPVYSEGVDHAALFIPHGLPIEGVGNLITVDHAETREARREALAAARSALEVREGGGAFVNRGSQPPGVWELLMVAQWIMSGDLPDVGEEE